MKPRFDFQKEWPGISRRVDAFLTRSRVPEALREDLIQETAIRILHLQDRIDANRSVGALANTIALNLLRDHIRKERHTVPIFDLSLVTEMEAVETEVIARDEWNRVSAAIDRLSPTRRAALLATAGLAAPPVGRSASAIRVLRMRARKQLRMILDAISRGKDACGLTALEMWKAFPLRRSAASQVPHGNQIAQVGTAVVAVLAASIMATYPSLDQPSEGSERGDAQIAWPSLEGAAPDLPVLSAAERGRLDAIEAMNSARANAAKRARRVKHRLSMGQFGYFEGDDDEVIGIIAKNVSDVKKRLSEPKTLVDRVSKKLKRL